MRLHSNENGSVLAIADAELIGKTLTDGPISFTVSEKFYLDQRVTEKELEKHLADAENINLVGEKSYAVVYQKGLIGKNGVKRIAGIPHAQIYRL